MATFYTIKNKQLTFFGPIDEAKRLAVELRTLSEKANVDLSTIVNDWVFQMEVNYQEAYDLDEDDWDEITCLCGRGECPQCGS